MLPNEVKLEMQRRVYGMVNEGNIGDIHYCFVTRHAETGKYQFHERPDQPCIGGELRKYTESHGEDNCTRPNDDRPGDLCHPFPKSKNRLPAGVCYHFVITEQGKQYIDRIIGADSPWIKAFGSPELIEYLELPTDFDMPSWWDEDSLPVVWGLSIQTGDIDPTVLVNFLKHVSRAGTYGKKYQTALDKGLSERDALIVATFGGGYGYGDDAVSESDGYMFSPYSDVKKFIRQETNDLTGGLWSERYDYNRPQMADVFKGEFPIGFIERVRDRKKRTQDFFVAARQVIAEELGEGYTVGEQA